MNGNNALWWYPFAILLFFIDLCINALLERQFLMLVLCAYLWQLYRPFHSTRLCTLAFLLCLEALIWYSNASIQLLILIPLTLSAYFLQQTFYKISYQKYVLLGVAIAGNTFFIEHVIQGLPISLPYTIVKIIGNIFLLWCFSLK